MAASHPEPARHGWRHPIGIEGGEFRPLEACIQVNVTVLAPDPSSGTINGMKTTIDSAGRIVIAKEIREALNLRGGDEIEVTLADERIELAPAPRKTKLRRGPHGLLTSDLKVPGYGPEKVREELERTRR